MPRVKGKWSAGWKNLQVPADTHEESFDHFLAAQKYVVAELSWMACDLDGYLGDRYMDAAGMLNDKYAQTHDERKHPWVWVSPGEHRYFIEWEPYPLSITESKLA